MEAFSILLREALIVTAVLVLPVLGLATLVGAIVAIVQAATQVQVDASYSGFRRSPQFRRVFVKQPPSTEPAQVLGAGPQIEVLLTGDSINGEAKTKRFGAIAPSVILWDALNREVMSP